MSYIRGNKKQIYRRKLNRKQIKFLIKFLLLLHVDETKWYRWGLDYTSIEMYKDKLLDEISSLLIRGYYSNERDIEWIISKWNKDCKFLIGKTAEVWIANENFINECLTEHGMYIAYSNTILWKYPTDVMKEIEKELKKKL